MSEKAQRAKALFLEGYNCAQAVAGAFAPEMGLSVDAAARLASGFGGGMGRMREVCGAVSGMTLAASALRGYNDPKAGPEKTDTYAMIQELAGRFRAENGSIICRELLGLARPEGTPQAEALRRELPYFEMPLPGAGGAGGSNSGGMAGRASRPAVNSAFPPSAAVRF